MTITLFVWLVAAIAIATLLLWPERGLAARWRRRSVLHHREQAENALKHLLGQSAAGQTATLASLQGALRASDGALLALDGGDGLGVLGDRQ